LIRSAVPHVETGEWDSTGRSGTKWSSVNMQDGKNKRWRMKEPKRARKLKNGDYFFEVILRAGVRKEDLLALDNSRRFCGSLNSSDCCSMLKDRNASRNRC